jgi:hypothetical protein
MPEASLPKTLQRNSHSYVLYGYECCTLTKKMGEMNRDGRRVTGYIMTDHKCNEYIKERQNKPYQYSNRKL